MTATQVQSGATRTHAENYLALGWMPTPVKLRDKGPYLNGWDQVVIDEHNVGEYFNATRQNIGIRLGAVSGGLVDVDLDCPEARVAAQYLLPPTGCTFGRAGSRRSHYLYNVGGDAQYRKLRDPEVRGSGGTLCEIRGDGGHQTVFPPSVHKETGEPIAWDSFEGEPPRIAETDLVRDVLRVAASALMARHWPGLGARQDAALALSGLLIRHGWDVDGATLFIRATAEAAGDDEADDRVKIPEYTKSRLVNGDTKVMGFPALVQFFGRAVVDQAAKWLELDSGRPRAMSRGPTPGQHTNDRSPATFTHDQTGNAERFAATFGGRFRYCFDQGRWFEFVGTHWRHDMADARSECFKQITRDMRREAADMEPGDVQKSLWKHAKVSRSASGIRGSLACAQYEQPFPIAAAEFDADPLLLNCANGTVDLRTGELREHQRADLITELAPVEYKPEAGAPIFVAFLERIFRGHPDVGAYMQRAIGYAACGVISEHALFVLYGTGANGKSTLMDAVAAALGDYAGKAEPDLLIASRNGSHPTGVADLCGLRLAVCSESNGGRRFDEQRVKDLTGERTIKARFMRQDFFAFPATHTLFLATNHKPEIRGTDHAIWRRVKLIPFTETIGDDERDPDLPEKLKSELPGILAWIVRGAVEWKRDGLNDPEEVKAAVAAYRAAEDVVGRWVDERCLTKVPGNTERSQRAYDDYREFCERQGEEPLKTRGFAEELVRRDFVKDRDSRGVYWKGFTLRAGESGGDG
ncbi:MAG: bifunctional DNA primase/polymerase [Planctomycetes bacterium]|nr:bifunctional DNA primase/polymerase [Planctomycetota bacterium]